MGFSDDAEIQLESIGYRSTAPRRAVLDAIESAAADTFTVEDLCTCVPAVGRATVFRTVRLLQDLDLVCRVPLEDGGVRYTLKSAGRFRNIDDIKDFPVRPGLKLGQIASVEPQKAVRDFIALSKTKPTLWCRVQKESALPGAEHKDKDDTVRFVMRDLTPELTAEQAFTDTKRVLEFVVQADQALGDAIGVDPSMDDPSG